MNSECVDDLKNVITEIETDYITSYIPKLLT